MMRFYCLLILFIGLLPICSQADEKMVLSRSQIVALCKGIKVRKIAITKDGEIWFFTVAARGKKAQLVRKDVFKNKIYRMSLPIFNVDHVAVAANGKSAIIYQSQGTEFWYLDVVKEKFTLLFKKEKGKHGIALYSGPKSVLQYGEHPITMGAYYDSQGRVADNYLFRFNISQTEPIEATFRKLLSQKKMVKIAKKHLKQAVRIGRPTFNHKYFTFAAYSKQKTGRIIAVDLSGRRTFVIDKFRGLLGSAIGPKNKNFAYIKNISPGNNALYLYNFSSKKSKKLLEGKLFDVTFDCTGNKLAVGVLGLAKGKLRHKPFHHKIVLVDLKNKTTEFELNNKKFFPYRRFVLDGQALMLFDGRGIFYTLDLQKKKKE